MKITIITPSKAILSEYTAQEISALSKQFSYTNTSVAHLIRRHHNLQWWKNKNLETWTERLNELQSQLRGSVLYKEGNEYWIRPGSIPYIENIEYTVENKIEYSPIKALPWKTPPDFEPYEHQKEAVQKLLKAKHGNISYGTGAGKSFILLQLAKNMGLNTVVVTPSQSIFNELLTEFQTRLGTKYVGGYGDGKKDLKKRITIAIGKSLTMLKPESEAYKFFSNKEMLAIDESHLFGAEQLEKVCHGVLSNIPYRFFVSGTQLRNDGTSTLLQSIIGRTVASLSLQEAIDRGFLCPLTFNIISTFSPSTAHKKEAIECKRVHLLYNNEVAGIIAKLATANWKIKQESTLILVEELRQIQMLTKLLDIPYAYVHSASKKEAALWDLEKVKLQDEVDKFNKGEVRILIGTRAIATGTNIYPTHNTVNWVGGSSEIVTKQGTMGRSTRKLEISKYAQFHNPKPICRIYDFKIKDQPILENQLKKRIGFYKDSGGKVAFF